MPRRTSFILALLVTAAAAVPFAGIRGGVEAYTWPEAGGWRTTFGLELFVDDLGAAFEFTYGVNLEFNEVNRMTFGIVRYYGIARRHALRFGFGMGMSYPLTRRDWYEWEHSLKYAKWEMNLDGGWRWEFTPGLALLADVRFSVGAGRKTDLLRVGPIETGVGLTGWLGLVVYP
jgi:hypothetical protein